MAGTFATTSGSRFGEKVLLKQAPDGSMMKASDIKGITLRTVKCTDDGDTVVEGDYSHSKVEVLRIRVHENHPELLSAGMSDSYNATLSNLEKKKQVSKFVLKVGGEELTWATGGGSLPFVMLPKSTSLPMCALLSLEYTSPMGDSRYVDDHELAIDYSVGDQGSCCVVA